MRLRRLRVRLQRVVLCVHESTYHFPSVFNELFECPDFILILGRIGPDIGFRYDEAHVCCPHFFKLVWRVALLKRYKKVSVPFHSVGFCYDLSPTIFAGCFCSQNNEVVCRVGQIVVCMA